MKKLALLTVVLALAFSSCTQDEIITDNASKDKMLESYVIKRNANGSYTLSHVVTNGVGTIYNDAEKANEVQLFFDGRALNNTFSHNYNITDNELNIEFLSENNTFQPKIKIIDDNTSGKGTYGLLNDYAVSENADGTIQLTFQVDAGVSVSYGYNQTEGINDIYLAADANAIQQSFRKVFSREANGSVKIDFVQPGLTNKEIDYRKPRLIFDSPD